MATASLIQPTTCRRCRSKGFGNWGPKGGQCYSCDGTGQVEGDKATLDAAKARNAAMAALTTAAFAHGFWAQTGLARLQALAPERFEKALASHQAGRGDVLDALAAYGREVL